MTGGPEVELWSPHRADSIQRLTWGHDTTNCTVFNMVEVGGGFCFVLFFSPCFRLYFIYSNHCDVFILIVTDLMQKNIFASTADDRSITLFDIRAGKPLK